MSYEEYQRFLNSDQILRQVGSDQPFTGKVICQEIALGYVIVFQVDVVDGRPHGLETTSGEDMKVFERSYWVRGRKSGTTIEWHENGAKRSEVQYVDGRRQGVQTEWDEDGRLHHTCVWKDDERDGLEKFWYPSGQLAKQTSWVDGRQHGPDIEWHENGQMASEGNKVNGVGQGPYTYWYENGQKQVQGTLVDGERHGLFWRWSEAGQLVELQCVDLGEPLNPRGSIWPEDRPCPPDKQ